jgi:hypothetical protein
MTKTAGSSDLRQRTRRKSTESEKAASQRERERKKRKTEDELREKNKAKGWFSVPAPALAAASAPQNEPDVNQPEPLDMRDGSDDDDDEDDDDNLYVDIAEPGLLPSTTTSVQEYNITADLDIEEDDNFEDAEEENDASIVMGLYLLAIQKRIRKETRDNNEDKWLHKLLKDDEYLIEVKRAKSICKKLSVNFSERYYYRDVRVWFPEIEFGQHFIPSCVSCKSSREVGVHGYFEKCPARRVIGLETNYFVMSRRYICHTCQKENG